ncbi:MAG: hypothetical protein KGI38_02455 [Thaumarchaeota archaeon]|nr:hypothetical protein [Nitrososphaerota archaeon]
MVFCSAKSFSLEVVMAYISALDRPDYNAAMNHLHGKVRIRARRGRPSESPTISSRCCGGTGGGTTSRRPSRTETTCAYCTT